MSARFEEHDRGYARLRRELERLDGAQIAAGVMASEPEQMRKVATIQEYGTREWKITAKQAYFMARRLMQIDPAVERARFWGTFRKLRGRTMRIPERSYMRASFDMFQAEIREAMRRSVVRVATGEATSEEQLVRFGLFVQELIQGYMVDLKDPANAPLTVFVKQSSNPLVDTGGLIKAITFEVRRGGVRA